MVVLHHATDAAIVDADAATIRRLEADGKLFELARQLRLGGERSDLAWRRRTRRHRQRSAEFKDSAFRNTPTHPPMSSRCTLSRLATCSPAMPRAFRPCGAHCFVLVERAHFFFAGVFAGVFQVDALAPLFLPSKYQPSATSEPMT